MSRAYLLAPISSARSVVVSLRNVPALPWKRLQRVLPGLLDAQVPMDLSECLVSFARNGAGVVGLVAKREDVEGAFAAQPRACGALPEGWLVWRQSAREGRDWAPEGRCAVVFRKGTGRVVVGMGRGRVFETTTEVEDSTEAMVRTLRMAFGAEAEGLECLCCGVDCESLVEALKASALQAKARASTHRELWTAKDGCLSVERTLWEESMASPKAETQRARAMAAWRMGLGLLLLGLSVVLGVEAFRVDGEREKAGRRLDLELTHRVDSIVGYPVTARGDRAVTMAKEAAAKREASSAERLLNPHVSRCLADVLQVLDAQEEIVVATCRVDADAVLLSGTALDKPRVMAFAEALRVKGFATEIELPPGAPGEALVRFLVTARRTAK